jgi:hypothetical protein
MCVVSDYRCALYEKLFEQFYRRGPTLNTPASARRVNTSRALIGVGQQ